MRWQGNVERIFATNWNQRNKSNDDPESDESAQIGLKMHEFMHTPRSGATYSLCQQSVFAGTAELVRVSDHWRSVAVKLIASPAYAHAPVRTVPAILVNLKKWSLERVH